MNAFAIQAKLGAVISCYVLPNDTIVNAELRKQVLECDMKVLRLDPVEVQTTKDLEKLISGAVRVKHFAHTSKATQSPHFTRTRKMRVIKDHQRCSIRPTSWGTKKGAKQ
jgi:hypothetical protein